MVTKAIMPIPARKDRIIVEPPFIRCCPSAYDAIGNRRRHAASFASGKCGQPDRLGKLTNGQLIHHVRAMHIDGAWADVKVVYDHLVRMS
jgi:hypothetical protein